MRRLCLLPAVVAIIASLGSTPIARGQQFELIPDDEGITVRVDGRLFTKYLRKSATKPVLWPILGPTGKEMTRGYPMRDVQGDERKDHIHHRSFWFTHGDVNGISFWDEQNGHGTIEHREFVKAEAQGSRAIIVTRNDWVGPDGKIHCRDTRTLVFSAPKDQRVIDFDVVIEPGEGPAKFGDTKEGSFAVRVGGSMAVDTKKGGRIVNSEGLTDAAAWGKRAAWVDYSGPIDGEIVGIAILNHPDSFRFPTYWHVRTYGLFAANPFGVHDFLGDKNADGSYTLEPGQTLRLRYRVIFHKGDAEEAGIAKAFQEYAGTGNAP